jgi:hypothetical protein
LGVQAREELLLPANPVCGTFQFSYRMSLGGVNTAATVTITVR